VVAEFWSVLGTTVYSEKIRGRECFRTPKAGLIATHPISSAPYGAPTVERFGETNERLDLLDQASKTPQRFKGYCFDHAYSEDFLLHTQSTCCLRSASITQATVMCRLKSSQVESLADVGGEGNVAFVKRYTGAVGDSHHALEVGGNGRCIDNDIGARNLP